MSPTRIAAELDNPVIDPEWYAKELSALHSKLAARFPELPGEVITVAMELATLRLAAPAKVPNYLPVLIERDVRAQLETYGRPPAPAPVPQVTYAPPAPAPAPVPHAAPAFPPAF